MRSGQDWVGRDSVTLCYTFFLERNVFHSNTMFVMLPCVKKDLRILEVAYYHGYHSCVLVIKLLWATPLETELVSLGGCPTNSQWVRLMNNFPPRSRKRRELKAKGRRVDDRGNPVDQAAPVSAVRRLSKNCPKTGLLTAANKPAPTTSQELWDNNKPASLSRTTTTTTSQRDNEGENALQHGQPLSSFSRTTTTTNNYQHNNNTTTTTSQWDSEREKSSSTDLVLCHRST